MLGMKWCGLHIKHFIYSNNQVINLNAIFTDIEGINIEKVWKSCLRTNHFFAIFLRMSQLEYNETTLELPLLNGIYNTVMVYF